MNGVDPSGLWATGSYLGDVGQVFAGYGDCIKDVFTAPATIYQYFSRNGLSLGSAWNFVKEGVRSWWDGLTGTTPRAFGSSFCDLLLAATPVIGKVPSPKWRATATVSATAATARPVIAGGRITGYTSHGLEQAMCREGVGVHPRAILDAVRNPQKVVTQPNGRIRYEGEGAVVVTELDGTVVTTWSKGSKWHRIPR